MNKLFDVRPNSRYLGFLLKQNFKLMIVLFITYFLVMPFTTFTSINDYNMENSFLSLESVSKSGFTMGTVIFIFTAILIPCILMNFIMNRSKMDTYQSLPIRRQDLFFNHFIEILIVILVPFVLNWFLVYGAILVKGFPLTHAYHLDALFKIILFSPILVGVTLFAYVCSGRFFDGLMYAAAIYISQFFAMAFVQDLFNLRLFGLSNFLDYRIANVFSYVISMWNWAFNNIFTGWTLFWIIMGVILYFVNQQLFIHRKVENIEDAAVYPWFIPIINTIAFGLFTSFLVLMFFYSESYLTSLVIPLTFGLIIYVIVDGITHRGFHKLYSSITRYILIATISVVLIYSAVLTGFMGTTKKIPKPDDFDTILLTTNDYRENLFVPEQIDFRSIVNGYNRIEDIINKFPNEYSRYETEVITDENRQQQVVNFHNNLVEAYYDRLDELGNKPHLYRDDFDLVTNNMNVSQYYMSVYLTYIKDKNIVMRRQYNLSSNVYNQFMEQAKP